MAINDINMFRVGYFNDATTSIKHTWYMVMLNLLPCICKKYLKAVRASELATKVTTVSDEALLLWLLALNSEKWTKEMAEKQEANDQDEEEPPKKKKRKQEGNHDSRVNISLFYEIYTRVLTARNDPITGEGWDKALAVEAERQLGNTKQGHPGEKPHGAQNAVYVVKYSPGKEMRLERMDGPTMMYEV